MEDIARLRRWKADATIDLLTLDGTFNANWTSQYWAGAKDSSTYYRDCPGGRGSIHYEYQLVGGEYNGVTFAKEEIWCYNAAGELVKEVPGAAGEHYSVMGADYHNTNYVGPEPGSKAEAVLGSGAYAWDETLELYEVV
jgi:hypothetical protein